MSRLSSVLPNKLLSLFGIVITLLILLTAAGSYYSSIRHMEGMIEESNTELLRQLNRRLELSLSEIDKTIITFMRTGEARRFFDGEQPSEGGGLSDIMRLQDQLINIVNSHSELHSIYLYSRGGMMLTDTIYTPANEFADMGWVKMYGEKDGYYAWTPIRAVKDPSDVTQRVVTLIRPFPLTNRPQAQKGLVAVNIKESVLTDILGELKLENNNAFIMNKNGVLLTGGRQAASYSKEQLLELLAYVRGSDSGFKKLEIGGEKSWLFYASSKYTGWVWCYIVPEHQIGQAFSVMRNVLLAIAGSMIVIALLLLMLVNRVSIKPLERFVKKIDTQIDCSGPQLPQTQGTDISAIESKFETFVSNYSTVEKKLRETLPAMKLRTLLDILTGSKTSFDASLPFLERVGVKLYPDHYSVMTVEFDHRWSIEHQEDWNLYSFGLCNVAEELVNGDRSVCQGAAVQVSATQSAVIVSFADSDALANQLTAMELAEAIRKYVDEHFRKTVTIGIGRSYSSFGAIKESYRESMELLKYKMVAGTNTVITWDDIHEYSNVQYIRVYSMIGKVIDAIRSTDKTAMTDRLEEMFGGIVKLNLPQEKIRQLCQQLIIEAYQTYINFGVEGPDRDLQDLAFQEIDKCETIQDIHELLLSKLADMIATISVKRGGKDKNELVAKVLEYIDENYHSSDLSQNYLAHVFELSPSYLSRIFKEHTSINFLNYLIDVRMKAAKELLQQSALTVNEIALRVGYTNLSSFLRIFKKYYGLTPSELRNQKQDE